MIEDIVIEENGKHLWGHLFLPDHFTSRALVILSHGYGSTHAKVDYYAEQFAANGIAAYSYDFTGGGSASRSGGDTTQMSVLTEADDLFTVMDHFAKDARFDSSRIFLFGASQGGFVSTYAAGKRPDYPAGLILLYPAYVLQDDSRRRNPHPETGPEETDFRGVHIGRIYDIDAQSFDIYDLMPFYQKEVLLIHGTADPIVPFSYSKRAEKTFPHASLHLIEGAGHGFSGQSAKEAADLSIQFVQKIIQ